MSVSSNQLTNGLNPSWDMTDIQVKAAANQVTAGSCTTGTNVTSYTSIYNAAESILVKASDVNELCTVTATDVTLKLEVPANQPLGSYSSVFTVNYPA